MTILLLGKNGQVGWELQRSLLPLGNLVALDRQGNHELCGDLSNLEEIEKTIHILKPSVIVNAAAYTAVDKAETDSEQAYLLNAKAVKVMAQAAKRIGALLIHYSTDYVFNGSGSHSWSESDRLDPINLYGQTKRAGEQFILESGCLHLIFRTSWVYAARGHNFIKSILRQAKTQDKMSVVADQIGAPTGADLIADITAHAIRMTYKNPDLFGIYHLASKGDTSWYEYAQFILSNTKAIDFELNKIRPILTSDYPIPARRPLNSRLNTEKLMHAFSLNLPDWKIGVTRVLTTAQY